MNRRIGVAVRVKSPWEFVAANILPRVPQCVQLPACWASRQPDFPQSAPAHSAATTGKHGTGVMVVAKTDVIENAVNTRSKRIGTSSAIL